MANQEPDFDSMTDAELAQWYREHQAELSAAAEAAKFELAKSADTRNQR